MDIHTEKARAFFFSLLAALLLFVGSKAAVRVFFIYPRNIYHGSAKKANFALRSVLFCSQKRASQKD
jgi:hypothetical protein